MIDMRFSYHSYKLNENVPVKSVLSIQNLPAHGLDFKNREKQLNQVNIVEPRLLCAGSSEEK